jgi:PAS domain S-box-containing protein
MEECQERGEVQNEIRRIVDALPGLVSSALPEGQIAELFRLIVDSVPTPVAVTTPTGEVEALNQPTLDYFGKTFAELKDWKTSNLVHPDDLSHTIAAQQKAHETGTAYNVESRHRRADGTYRWFNVVGLPLRDPQGQILRWFHLQIDIDDRKRAEEALRAAERNLTQVINTIPSLSWSARPDGTAEFFNEHYLDYVGLSAEQAAGWGWMAAVHPDDLNGLQITWQRIMSAGEPGEAEARLRRVDGEYRWFLFRANPARDQTGSIARWYGTNTDIDDRKRAEAQRDHTIAELQAQQELLELAQKSAGAMAFDWYTQREINYWSPEQEALFGLTPGTFDGTYKSWKKMMYAPDWPLVVAAIQRAHQTGQVTAEYRVVWPDGSLHWLATKGQMFFDDQGKPFRMVGFTSDVTPRKLAEEELRRSEAFLAEAQHLSSTGSFSWRVETEEITWSEQAYHIFGFDPAGPITLELIRSRVHPDDIPLFDETIQRTRATGGDFEFEHRLLLPDQSVKYLRVIAHGPRDQNGTSEYIGAVQDVTDRRLSEEALGKLRSELAHVSRAVTLGALTASIAHEVNQPLSGIITNASTCLRMLAADPPNVDGARETARRTIRDGHRASDVITRLRALFSRKEAATEMVDLNEATREVIALSQSELRKGRVIVREELADDIPPVTGDRVQLQQVMLNLLLNAADAMSGVEDRPRQLVIKSMRDEGECVLWSVQDAGVGLNAQDLERIFDAFYTTKSSGMGIGLSVSRFIVESHHGRLWATPNDGPGATFSFSLPHASGAVSVASGQGAIPTPDLEDAERTMEGS